MRTYTRVRVPGGCYFFTLTLAQRDGKDLLVRHVAHPREAFRRTRADRPFDIDGIAILPDHLHCIWRMPDGDSDFAMRWQLIRARFSRSIASGEHISPSRQRKGERGIWQRRYWEHLIRDDRDYWTHMDYLHFNPVRHGYVAMAKDWPYSSFRRWVGQGAYDSDWGVGADAADLNLE